MNYEIAKQLRDAGFPFKEIMKCPICPAEEMHFSNITLSQLIEGCGEGFFAISHWYDGWQSEGGPVIEGEKRDKDGKRTFTAQIQIKHCKTAEESVAKLWLALKAPPASEEPSQEPDEPKKQS